VCYSLILLALHPHVFQPPLLVLFLQFIDQLLKDARFKLKLSKPSVSYHGDNLYMQAPPVLEEMTRPNLELPLLTLMDGKISGVLNINDRRLTGVLRVRVTFKEGLDSVDMDTAGGG
jgi:ubiquitin-activating enzyme E1 C